MTNLQFPADHDAKSGMWFSLIEYNYSRPTIDSSFKPIPTGTTVTLPIPPDVRASYSAEWGQETSSAAMHLIEESARHAIGNSGPAFEAYKNLVRGKEGSFEALKNLTDTIKTEAGPLSKLIGRSIASDLVTGLPGVDRIAASMGIARNPWLAATFTGVGFRSFPYSYNFFPRSVDESKMLDQIYTRLKYGMHPSYDQRFANNIFKYPNMYAPVFQPNDYLFDFGFCVIKDLTVNYHKEGAPIYFSNDGKKLPSSMTLSFTLQEIEVVTKESIIPFGDQSNGAVGGDLATRVDSLGNPAGRVTRGR